MEYDLSRLPLAVRQKMDDIFRRDFDLRVLKAIERQTRTATQRRDAVQWHPLMNPQYEVDGFVDTMWRRYYGHNYSENPDLMKFLGRRNPEIVMRPRSPKIQVGYSPSPPRTGRGQGEVSKFPSPAGAGEGGRRPGEGPLAKTIPRRAVRFDRGTIVFAK